MSYKATHLDLTVIILIFFWWVGLIAPGNRTGWSRVSRSTRPIYYWEGKACRILADLRERSRLI